MFSHLHFISFRFIFSTVHSTITIAQQFSIFCLVFLVSLKQYFCVILFSRVFHSLPLLFYFNVFFLYFICLLFFIFPFCTAPKKRKAKAESRVSAFKVLLFLFLFLHFYSGYTACEMAWEKHINFLTLVHSH